MTKSTGKRPFKERVRSGSVVPCVQCGKEVYRYPGNMGKKFCSMACRDSNIKEKRVNDEESTARCAKCREWKPLDDFVKGIKGRPHSYCKPCSSDWFAVRRGTPVDERKPYQPAYRLTDGQKKANRLASSRKNHLRRRAAGKPPGKWEISQMLCRQDCRCAYCKELLSGEYHIDHKTPVARGGTNDIENLHITCPRCNMIKGTMTHEEFLVSKKRRPVAW